VSAKRKIAATGRSRRFTWTPLLIAGAFVLVFWVVLLGQAEQSVFGRVPILDEVYYLDRAAEISAGQIRADEPHFMSPLYPFLVAAAGAGGGVPADRVFSGSQLRGLRVLQIACWLGTLVLIRLLAGSAVPPDWRGRRRAVAVWLPVLLFVLYRPAAVYTMAVLLETPLLFLVTLSLYLMSGPGRKRNHPGWLMLLGMVLGLAGLLRGTALLLVPVAVGVLWCSGAARSRIALGTGLILVGVATVLAGPVVHNSRLAGRLVGPSLNGGVNLYIGNGPDANGFYVAAVPGDWRHDPAGRAFLAERFNLAEVSLPAADRMWAREAWHHMRNDPLRVSGLMVRKIWLQLQGWEIDQLTPLDRWTAQAPVLRLLVTPYALLVVLGLAGLTRPGGHRIAWLLAATLVVLLVGQSLFFIVSRYRLVLVPVWAVLAGIGTVQLFRLRRAAWAVAVLATVLTVPWGLSGVRASWNALALANEAVRWADVGAAGAAPGAWQRAESLYRRSLTVEDSHAASWLGLAAVLGEVGRPDEKGAVLRQGVARVTQPLTLQKVLLTHELEQGKLDAALTLAQTILRDHPRDADTLHNTTILLARSGQPKRALATAERLRLAHPDKPQGHVDVGVLLARAGRIDEARLAFANGLKHCPHDADLARNLSLLDE